MDDTPADHETKQPEIKKTKPQFIKVDKLSPASVGFNLIVKVGAINAIMNRLNLDGTTLRISEAIIGDSTASIILSLRNDQIKEVKCGDVLILRNAKIDMVNNGYMRVAIDRWGLIEKVNPEQIKEEINTENNLSEVEYELVKEPSNDDYGGGRGYGGRGRGRGRGRRGGYGGRGRRGGYNNNYRGGGGGRRRGPSFRGGGGRGRRGGFYNRY